MSKPAPENTLFSPGVERLYAQYLDSPMLACVRVVCADTARQHAVVAAPVSLGYLSFKLAVGLGLPMSMASRVGTVLDAIQPVIDLTDNLADEELDRALGRGGLDVRYPNVARDVLHCLPPLMMACVVASLHADFPSADFRPREAAKRLIQALAQMTTGQGQGLDDPERVDNISGHQGTLLCLPLWLLPGNAPQLARLEAVERWAFLYGRVWQLYQDVLDAPDADAPAARFRAGRREAIAAWPDFGPFSPGASLSPEVALARGPS